MTNKTLLEKRMVSGTITHQNSQTSIQAIVSDTFFPSRVERGTSNSLHHSFVEWPRLPCTAPSNDRHVPSKLARYLSRGWRLIDLPLRASNEGSPRPRVARAQKIISLHPLLPSSWGFREHGGPTRPPLPLLLRRFLGLSGPLLCRLR